MFCPVAEPLSGAVAVPLSGAVNQITVVEEATIPTSKTFVEDLTIDDDTILITGPERKPVYYVGRMNQEFANMKGGVNWW